MLTTLAVYAFCFGALSLGTVSVLVALVEELDVA